MDAAEMAATSAAQQQQIQDAVNTALAAAAVVPPVPVAHVATKLPTFWTSEHVVFSGRVFAQQVMHHQLLHQV